jgi:protein transport protein SEC61 subunit alpha
MLDPLHFIIYLIFIMTCCALFSKLWIEISGEGPKEIAKKLKNEEMVLTGHRNTSLIKVLNKYIPIAAACGGIMIGLLTVIADFLGAIGSGNTNIFIYIIIFIFIIFIIIFK